MSKEKEYAKFVVDSIKSYNKTAMIHITKQNYDEAIRIFERVLKLHVLFKYQKGIGETYFNIANAYIYKNDLTNAKTYLNKSKETFEDISSAQDVFCVNFTLGNIHLPKDREKAFSFFQECIKYDRYYENSLLLYTLSDLYREREEFQNAIDVKLLLLKNKKLSKKDLFVAHKEIGKDFAHLDMASKAIFHFNKAISLSNDRKERDKLREEIKTIKSK